MIFYNNVAETFAFIKTQLHVYKALSFFKIVL